MDRADVFSIRRMSNAEMVLLYHFRLLFLIRAAKKSQCDSSIDGLTISIEQYMYAMDLYLQVLVERPFSIGSLLYTPYFYI